jgi:hypothetical protein
MRFRMKVRDEMIDANERQIERLKSINKNIKEQRSDIARQVREMDRARNRKYEMEAGIAYMRKVSVA